LSEINKIEKTIKEYKEEFKYKLYGNRKMASKINIQFEEIRRLEGELKFEIISTKNKILVPICR